MKHLGDPLKLWVHLSFTVKGNSGFPLWLYIHLRKDYYYLDLKTRLKSHILSPKCLVKSKCSVCCIKLCALLIDYTQGSHPNWTTTKTCNFAIYFSRSGICSKVGKAGIWTQNLVKKKLKVVQSVFQIHFSRCHFNTPKNNKFTSLSLMSYLHYQHIDSKPNSSGISLLLPGYNQENTWNFVSPEKWEPWYCIRMNGWLDHTGFNVKRQ